MQFIRFSSMISLHAKDLNNIHINYWPIHKIRELIGIENEESSLMKRKLSLNGDLLWSIYKVE